jgi:hypothetical protein
MASSPKSKASAFVTVACKLPQGLHIVIPDQKIDVRLHGTHSPYAVAGFGLTEVKADVWAAIEAFYSTHAGARWLHNGTVFAQVKHESAAAAAKENVKHDAGFEAVDPNNPNKAANASAMIQVEGSRDPGEGS